MILLTFPVFFIWCFGLHYNLMLILHCKTTLVVIDTYISIYHSITIYCILSIFSLNKLKTMKNCVFIVFNIYIMTFIFFIALCVFKLLSLVFTVCLNFLFVFRIRQICYPFCSIWECLVLLLKAIFLAIRFLLLLSRFNHV